MAMQKHQVLIVGGGSAGITVAASLRKRSPNLDVSIVEPADRHYYQPAFSLVGAGEYDVKDTWRPTPSVIPQGVKLIRAAAQAFRPEDNAIDLSDGTAVGYDWLIVATGLALDWDKVPGLKESLGKNSVCSNYSPVHVPYTWDCVRNL
ncbi:MAG: FAD-dependent oxidoreductase, partial [Alphaproteobacteria bacterium]